MKTSFKTNVLAATFICIASTHAMAFDTDEIKDNQAPLSTEFNQLDKSGDGLLSYTEASEDKLFTKKRFAKADVDKDGTLDQDEYSTYKSKAVNKNVSRVVDDSVITTKAKEELLRAKDIKSLQISVETYKGEVILSGFVENAAMKEKAEKIVAKIEGVKAVKNSLEVKS